MKILVGSQAFEKHCPGLLNPKDTDYFSDTKIEGAETFYDTRLEDWSWSGPVASLDELYTIKISHAFWALRNRSWTKHMNHMMLMKENGATFIPELYEILYPIWKDRYGVKKANLNKNPEDFFTSTVKRIYDHDSIHASVAFNDEPLFNKILKDDSEVAVSREKFESLTELEKEQLVLEEVFATALEREYFNETGVSYKRAYQKHLFKLITSYSKGWFPLYIVLNFEKFCKTPFDYYKVMENNKDKLIPLE